MINAAVTGLGTSGKRRVPCNVPVRVCKVTARSSATLEKDATVTNKTAQKRHACVANGNLILLLVSQLLIDAA